MKTKNLTAFLFGPKVTSLRPGQLQMAMVVRGSFKLRPGEPLAVIDDLMEQGPLKADEIVAAGEDSPGECVYASDFADFKLHADLLLAGTCHAPGGRPATECPVRFTVGGWSKTLLVVGRRVWTEKLIGAAISDPHPFTTMPLRYANSFGGPSYAQNPAGKGRETPELPNVEHPGARVRGKGDRPEPAGFGPLSPAWPQRAGKVGSQYSAKWKKERAPFYAEDFDWTYFNAAPADQQLQGYLRGDEEVSFVNLHPTAPSFSARLPALRVRAFAKDKEGTLREAVMNLDTLFADVDSGKLVLTWRGLVPVKEDDLTDVRTVLIASEPLADPLLPEAHYRQILETFEADPLEIERHMPGGSKKLAALQAMTAEDDAHPERTPEQRAKATLDNEDALLALVPEEQHPAAREAIAKAKADLASAGAAGPVPPSPGPTASALLDEMSDAVKKMRSSAGELGIPLEDVEQLEKMLDDPQTRKSLTALTPPRSEEIGPGKDLSGRNLGKMDLSGRDLSGAYLSGANLGEARLAGACLARANLKEAILVRADLEGADLSDADLSRALMGRAHAPRANLQRATLDMTVMEKTDLRAANFAQARGQMALFSGADLTEASFNGVSFYKVFADGANLERADFTDARLLACSFLRSKASGVVLTKAFLTNTSFADSDLRGAKIGEARGEGASFIRADLADADLRLAALPAAHFMEAKAVGTKFVGADLRRSEFYRACLDRADFGKANLAAASLNKATLTGTRFVGANLYDARFLGAGGKDTNFQDANLKRAMFPIS
jgi:uncharacterized protein YjbI with pentapeptide repeats